VKTTTGENSGLLELEAFMFNIATLMAYSRGHELARRPVVKEGEKSQYLVNIGFYPYMASGQLSGIFI
tara:strand:- start:13658 stop:13861 length:204 start_codon:yes stop_codon:yes gene_type:complete